MLMICSFSKRENADDVNFSHHYSIFLLIKLYCLTLKGHFVNVPDSKLINLKFSVVR